MNTNVTVTRLWGKLWVQSDSKIKISQLLHKWANIRLSLHDISLVLFLRLEKLPTCLSCLVFVSAWWFYGRDHSNKKTMAACSQKLARGSSPLFFLFLGNVAISQKEIRFWHKIKRGAGPRWWLNLWYIINPASINDRGFGAKPILTSSTKISISARTTAP